MRQLTTTARFFVYTLLFGVLIFLSSFIAPSSLPQPNEVVEESNNELMYNVFETWVIENINFLMIVLASIFVVFYFSDFRKYFIKEDKHTNSNNHDIITPSKKPISGWESKY